MKRSHCAALLLVLGGLGCSRPAPHVPEATPVNTAMTVEVPAPARAPAPAPEEIPALDDGPPTPESDLLAFSITQAPPDDPCEAVRCASHFRTHSLRPWPGNAQ